MTRKSATATNKGNTDPTIQLLKEDTCPTSRGIFPIDLADIQMEELAWN